MQDEQVFDVIRRLVSAAKWSGVAHMDLRCDNLDGRVKLLETNARYWGSLIGSLVTGVNFPYLACLAALNVSFPIPAMFLYLLGGYVLYAVGKQCKVTQAMVAVGVLNVTLNLVVIPRWSYLEATVALFSWTDPAPFLGDLQRAMRLFLSPEERRKRDYRNPLSGPKRA